jgi:hypothetical protein
MVVDVHGVVFSVIFIGIENGLIREKEVFDIGT